MDLVSSHCHFVGISVSELGIIILDMAELFSLYLYIVLQSVHEILEISLSLLEFLRLEFKSSKSIGSIVHRLHDSRIQ